MPSIFGNVKYGQAQYGQVNDNNLPYIKVYDKLDKNFTTVKYIITNCTDANFNSNLNGQETLTFDLPFTNQFSEEDYVELYGYNYIIRRTTLNKGSSGNILHCECEGLYSELIDSLVQPDPSDVTLLSGSLQMVLTRIVAGTGWSVVANDYSDWDLEMSNVYDKTVLEAVNYVVQNWKEINIEMEFARDRKIYVRPRGSFTGVQINYNINMETIEKTIDTTSMYTRLTVYGMDDLELIGYNATGLDQTGFHCVDNIVVENYIDSPTINNYAYPKHGTKSYENISTKEDLFLKMKELRTMIGIPQVSYKINYLNLDKIGVNFSDINIGDTITIIDNLLGNFNVRVVELDENPFKFDLSSATLSTLKEDIVSYLSSLSTMKSSFETYKNKNDGKFLLLDSTLASVNEILNGTGSNTLYDSEMIKSWNESTPNEYLKIANGRLGITKDGGATLKTAIDGNGVYADTLAGNLLIGKNGSFGNINIYQDINNPINPLVQIGTIGTNKYGIKINGGALEITDGGLPSSQIKNGDAWNAAAAKANNSLQLNDYIGSHMKFSNANGMQLFQDANGVNERVRIGLVDNTYGISIKNSSGATVMKTTSTGDLDITGTIHATAGDFSGNVYAQNFYLGTPGNYTNALSNNQINGGVINAKGITVKNLAGQETFKVDLNGNVTLSGGQINFTSKIPNSALDARPANWVPSKNDLGNYLTHIDENGIYTGTLTGNVIQTGTPGLARLAMEKTGLHSYNSNGDYHGINIDSGNFSKLSLWYQGQERAYIEQAAGTMQIRGKAAEIFMISETSNIHIKPGTGWNNGTNGSTQFYGQVDFTNATVYGMKLVFN